MRTDLRTLVIQGNYHLAMERFDALTECTPQDERFAGLALFNLGRHKDSRQILLQAIAHGYIEAKIELACLIRHTGDFRVAATLLATLDASLLQPFDRCLYLYERSALDNEAGRRDDAISGLEQAWLLSFEVPEGQALQPGIAQTLGSLYTESGFDDRAADHFDFAIQHGLPNRQANARLARSRTLVYVGREQAAREDLRQVNQKLNELPNLLPLYSYNLGILERFFGALEPAKEAFTLAIEQARALGHANTEAYAKLALSAVYLETGEVDQARQHLFSARRHLQTDRIRLYFLLREGALLNALSDPCAIPTLEEATRGFESAGLYRETAWAALHLADGYGRMGDSDAMLRALSQVTDQRHVIGNSFMLKAELRALPTVQCYLESIPTRHYVQILLNDYHLPKVKAPQHVLVQSMGHARVLLDGQPARFELARSVEVLVYILCHPHQSLTSIITHLFPETDTKLAKNYFHQVRYDLARAIPGLSLPFDRLSRTYGVQLDKLTFEWDVNLIFSEDPNVILTAQNFLEKTRDICGPFLPLVETEWAETERYRIHWQVMRMGFCILDLCFPDQITSECEQVIERLLQLEPFSETLAIYQVKCARLLHGEAYAAAQLEGILRRYMDEFGEVPEELLR